MAITRLEALKEILRPWYIKVFAGATVAIPTYDALSNQVGLPKIRELWGMSGSLLPWWGWLPVLQTVFVYALFDYVRQTASGASDRNADERPTGRSLYADRDLFKNFEDKVELFIARAERIERETVESIEKERSDREVAVNAIMARQDDDRKSLSDFNDQMITMINSENEQNGKRANVLHHAIELLPSLIGWESTSQQMEKLDEAITKARCDVDGEPQPAPTNLIDQFVRLSDDLKRHRFSLRPLTEQEMPYEFSPLHAYERAPNWGIDWERYRKASYIYRWLMYSSIYRDDIFRE